MKLNFWQVLGGIVLLVGIILLIRREMAGSEKPSMPAPVIPAPTLPVPAKTPG